jgi:hypothetical protein
MTGSREAYVGIDAAKSRNAVAIAEEGRDGEVRYLGEFDATPESMRRLVTRLAAKYGGSVASLWCLIGSGKLEAWRDSDKRRACGRTSPSKAGSSLTRSSCGRCGGI